MEWPDIQMWLLCTMPNIQPIIFNNMLMIIALICCTCDRPLQNYYYYYYIIMVCLLIVCFVVHIVIVCPVDVIARQSLVLYFQFKFDVK